MLRLIINAKMFGFSVWFFPQFSYIESMTPGRYTEPSAPPRGFDEPPEYVVVLPCRRSMWGAFCAASFSSVTRNFTG